jgi:hypothetical protein
LVAKKVHRTCGSTIIYYSQRTVSFVNFGCCFHENDENCLNCWHFPHLNILINWMTFRHRRMMEDLAIHLLRCCIISVEVFSHSHMKSLMPAANPTLYSYFHYLTSFLFQMLLSRFSCYNLRFNVAQHHYDCFLVQMNMKRILLREQMKRRLHLDRMRFDRCSMIFATLSCFKHLKN